MSAALTPSGKPKLLIVHDDEVKTALLNDYDVFLAPDRRAAVEVFEREKPAVVILDLGLLRSYEADEDFSTLRDILVQETSAKMIVMTTQQERKYALEAIDRGAYDFLTKPIDLDVLKLAVRRALYTEELEKERGELRRRLSLQVAAGSETQQLRREGESLRAARARLDRSLIQDALAKHRGNLTRAADDLGVSRPTLYDLMHKLGIPRR
jgi:DNA-binding NtrC family response regulator